MIEERTSFSTELVLPEPIRPKMHRLLHRSRTVNGSALLHQKSGTSSGEAGACAGFALGRRRRSRRAAAATTRAVRAFLPKLLEDAGRDEPGADRREGGGDRPAAVDCLLVVLEGPGPWRKR
jgi:hypothetical protein